MSSNGGDLAITKSLVGRNSQSGKNGIGIENLRKQLSLQYPNRHNLKIEETESDFMVKLNIEL